MSAHELPPLPPPEDEVLIKRDDGTDWFCPAALPYFTETDMHTYGNQCKEGGIAQANRDAVMELLREARAELLTVRRINRCDDLIDKIDRALKEIDRALKGTR